MDVFAVGRQNRLDLIAQWLAIPLPEDVYPRDRARREYVASVMSNDALTAAILRDSPSSPGQYDGSSLSSSV